MTGNSGGRFGGKGRSVSVAEEHDEQAALCRSWALYARGRGIPENLLFAIPNGGRRDAVTGARLKAEGVRAGIPDLFLAVPRGQWAGLFIEMKRRRGGRVSSEQEAMLACLAESGYGVSVCKGWDEARAALEAYMGGKVWAEYQARGVMIAAG